MAYPIKYIENNLVLNHDGEWWAYYELIPYNYSFLADDEKHGIYDVMRQLVSQSVGSMHFLQIAAEKSISNIAGQSVNYISGSLSEAALERIDEQRRILVSMIGETQLDYRFFIGFQLVSDTVKSLKESAKGLLSDFVNFFYSANSSLAGDFVSVPNPEIRRYMKLEQLLYSKLSRRFKFRRLNKDDFGYIIGHIYGRCGSYEDYCYHLPVKRLKEKTYIKKYDLLRPARSLVDEKGRYLVIDNDDDGRQVYVSYFTVEDIVDELAFPGSELFYYSQEFSFPVSVSMNVEIVPNRSALYIIRNKKKELNDLDSNAWKSGNDAGRNVADALSDADELEDDLNSSHEAMYKLSYVIRVSADSLDELNIRCNVVRDYYDDCGIKLVRPFGDMAGLHGEFIPSSRRYIDDYVQYVKSDFLAGLGFGATQQLGDDNGIYMGYNVYTGKNVYLKPWLAAQGVKGSVTNALAAAFLGSLGGGKSFANNLLVYYAVLFGGRAVVVDPKSERGGWPEALPEIACETKVVNITNDEINRGMLDPYVIMANLRDSDALALDILMFLTGVSARDGEKFTVLRNAVRSVTNGERHGLMLVIDELRNDGSPAAVNMAAHLESLCDYDFAHLLFSDGMCDHSISLDRQLNIIQVADLVLPEKGTSACDYTAVEMLSVSMLIVISTFALDFIHSDRSIFKIVDLDEAWTFLNVSQGKVLANKLIRAGRSMNAGVYFVTQSAADLQDEQLRNNIGLKFAFRSNDLEEIRNTLEFFGLDPDDENNQKALRSLENGQCLMQDIYGRTGVVHIHPVFKDLFDAFDTRPPVEERG